MKQSFVTILSIFVLLCIGFGIAGFILFNKRLAESKKIKEFGEITTQRTLPTETMSSQSTTSALENSLKVQITSPSDQSTVTSPSITLRGKTVAQAEVFVNEKETIADAGGNFSVNLILEEGDNPIMVVANDQSGNVGESEITVIYDMNE